MSEALTNPINLGIVGCGAIAAVHGEAMQASRRNIRFAACADLNLDNATSWAKRFQCPAIYGDMLEMVRREQLDGIILATWPSQHAQHVSQLIDAGVRFILCEKSLTTSGPLAVEMLEKARRSGTVLIEAFMLRHHPLFVQLSDLVRDGEVGDVDTIRASFQELDREEEAKDSSALSWRQRKQAGGGVGYDGTCYPLHVCNHLAGSLPARVAFNGLTSRYDTPVRLHGYIAYENNVTALIHSSLRAVVGRETEVTGTEASLLLPIAFGFNIPEHDAIRKRTGISNLTMKDVVIPPPPREGAHENRLAPRLQLENFADVIRGLKEPRIRLIESVVNAFTLDAILASAEGRSVVEVRLPDSVRAEWRETVGNA